MIAAPLAIVFAVHSALAPFEATSRTDSLVHSTHSAVDSQEAQPGRFDAARFDSATAITLRSILDTAAAHGIPTAALISLAYQGSAMHSPSAKIVSAVRSQYVAMVDARAALGDGATDSELSSGAEALRHGVDGKALVAIRSTRPSMGSAVTALVVLNDLLDRGIPNGKARDAVTSLARVSKGDDKLNTLQQLVAKNSERGPGMAQDALDRYVRVNAPGGNPPAGSKPITRPPGPPDAS